MRNRSAQPEIANRSGNVTSRVCWHIITGEYPPQAGGVSDYTHQIAQSLVGLNHEVHVWVPACKERSGQVDSSIVVHEIEGTFTVRDLRAINEFLKHYKGPTRLLVQYVPQAFGFKGLNLVFCAWLLTQRRFSPWIMFHEVAYPIGLGQSLKHNLLGVIHRIMAFLVVHAANRLFVSTSSWAPMLGTKCECLPMPSNIPRIPNRQLADAARTKYKTSEYLVGHFGTYGNHIKPLLRAVIQAIYATSPSVSFLLLGRGAEEFTKEMNTFVLPQGTMSGVGNVSSAELSAHISACDLMIQPFLDGVTTRRTSVMASLAHGMAVVTTSGPLTESVWSEQGALALSPVGRPDIFATLVRELLMDQSLRASLSERAIQTYNDKFSIEEHMWKLLEPGAYQLPRSLN